MPEIKVTDEKGITHVFPDGSTPEMIAKAMKVKYNGSAPATANAEKLEGFWESLGHTFGIGKEEAEAQNKELKEHPIRSVARALAGPAGMLAEGGYHGFMRTTGEAGQAMDAALKEKNPYRAGEHAVYALPFVGAGIKRGVEQLGPNELINRAEVGTALGTAIQTAPLVADAAAVPIRAGESKIGSILKGKYGPREIPVGDEKVPVTVGEAEPTSAAGRKATQLKRSGVGAKKFDKFEAVQQAKVKSAMRNLAQQTSGATGPMPEEPGAAMKYGADTVFETARPMYAALDEELVTVPGDLHSASAIVKQAIARAKKLGYDFEASKELHYGEEPLGLGKPVSDASHTLSDFQKIRSELGKMRRGSRDPAVRYQISEEMKQMTAAMDKALDNTGLKDTWKEADRLWAKGYAMNSIADALKSATKGAESAAQPKGIEVVPSEIKGASLEETLKDLSDDGTLERGLNHDEISNLRQSANILKRAEGTSTGSGYGESGSRSRAIAHILRGAPGPVAGAGIGGAIGMMSGHGFIVGAEAGGFAGFIVQSIGERALVRVMTKLDGVRALDAVADAKTPAEVNSAMTKLAAVAAASAPKKRPGDLLRQAQ